MLNSVSSSSNASPLVLPELDESATDSLLCDDKLLVEYEQPPSREKKSAKIVYVPAVLHGDVH